MRKSSIIHNLICLFSDAISQEYKQRGVIAASAGNHALAMAYHGRQLGIPIFVVMPKIAPIMKVNRCKQHGATILIKGEDIGEVRSYIHIYA